jgi:hypothetical protein
VQARVSAHTPAATRLAANTGSGVRCHPQGASVSIAQPHPSPVVSASRLLRKGVLVDDDGAADEGVNGAVIGIGAGLRERGVEGAVGGQVS